VTIPSVIGEGRSRRRLRNRRFRPFADSGSGASPDLEGLHHRPPWMIWQMGEVKAETGQRQVEHLHQRAARKLSRHHTSLRIAMPWPAITASMACSSSRTLGAPMRVDTGVPGYRVRAVSAKSAKSAARAPTGSNASGSACAGRGRRHREQEHASASDPATSPAGLFGRASCQCPVSYRERQAPPACFVAFSVLIQVLELVSPVGLEPTAPRLKVSCDNLTPDDTGRRGPTKSAYVCDPPCIARDFMRHHTTCGPVRAGPHWVRSGLGVGGWPRSG